ncbi:hypothetical protein J437_LFUL002969 [Ladona fulva]|uniref:Calcium channel flower n=1 Tax=Ladona fulva TaxID=123851 RepID=A0A8K0KB59_LADFU|nr:hypothetical protein J437_LFUL002969 [Ladona fulva]
MSFAEKIGAMMQRPGQDAAQKDDVPWWMKYAGRGLGTVGGLLAIGLGVSMCFGIVLADVGCLLGGIWQMIAGFLVVVVEAPCCCMFIDFVQNISDWVERKPYFYRGAFYCGIALPSVFMCFGFSSIIGSGLIFATGVIYGMMSLGKKGTREDMASAATGTAMSPTSQMPPGGGGPAYQQGGVGGGVGMGGPGDMQHSTLMEDPDFRSYIVKEATVVEMRNNATVELGQDPSLPSTSQANSQLPSSEIKSTLVDNAQPVGISPAPILSHQYEL